MRTMKIALTAAAVLALGFTAACNKKPADSAAADATPAASAADSSAMAASTAASSADSSAAAASTAASTADSAAKK